MSEPRPTRRSFRKIFFVSLPLVAALVIASAAPGSTQTRGDWDPPTLLDDIFYAIGERVASFAGASVEGETLIVYQTREGRQDAEQVQALLVTALGAHAERPHLESRVVDWSFTQLKDWHDALVAAMAPPLPFVLSDVDERANRVLLGVQALPLAAPAIQETMLDLGIPPGAVTVKEFQPIKPTLQSKRRPIVGGLRISGQSSVIIGYNCTLGFVATQRQSVQGFVTNSHCSNEWGATDGGWYAQPLIDFPPTNYVAEEIADPAYSTGGACTPGWRCRYSDANFSRMLTLSFPYDTRADQARIARSAVFSQSWNGVDKYRVTSKGNHLEGATIWSVGQISGRTQGTVAHTCVNVTIFNTDRIHLCQNSATYSSIPGDSGGPVFSITNAPAMHDVRLGGVNWGANNTHAFYSPIPNIELELGTLAVCDAIASC